MNFGTIKSSEIGRFGVMTAPFFLSKGYKMSEGKSSTELVSEADTLLKGLSQYELDNAHSFVVRMTANQLYNSEPEENPEDEAFVCKTRAEMEGNYVVREMVSSAVEKKFWTAIERRSVSSITRNMAERLQISVLVLWVIDIKRSSKNIQAAKEKMKALKAEMDDLQKYLEDNYEKDNG